MRTNQAVTIDNSKIYTSYFSKGCKIFPDRRLVSISITSAKNFNGSYARELNPSKELLWAYKNGEINTDQYIEWYTNTVLNKLNPFEIYEKYKGKVLCCWEKSGEFCHRHIVMKWIALHVGINAVGGEI